MRQLSLIGILFWANFLLVTPILLAQKGNIIESGDSVLDPNGDGFISVSSNGFIGDGYDVDEFEIKMFGIPIFGDGEALRDISSGAQCGVSDLAFDEGGYAMYAAYDDAQNVIFRMRVAGDKQSVQSYSIMIDTDDLIGNDDPNSNSSNPGFEAEVTLIHRFGVFIYDIDGLESCPTPLRQYDVSTHQQKSTSSVESCNDEDYFIDFYIPIQDLIDLFGIDADTQLRFVGLTNISATCALDGSISDIGGVDDTDYNGCFQCAILDLTENQCPSSLSNLCETCAGFPEGATQTPEIDLPVIVGDTEITGIAEPEAAIFIKIFSGDGLLVQSISTDSNIDGNWTSNTLDNGLNFQDSVVVNALLPGKCESGLNDVGLSFVVVSPNRRPVITGALITVTYIENSPPLVLDETISINDDNVMMQSASIAITQNLEAGIDILGITPPPGVNVQYLLSEGKIILTGLSGIDDYIASLRSVTFHNTNEAPDQSIREITYQVFDGLNYSQPYRKNLLITEVNDPPEIPTGNSTDTLYYETQEDTPLSICIDASDVDSDILFISSASVKDGNGQVIIGDGTCLEFIPLADYNGMAYIEIEICDDGSPSLCDVAVLAIDITPVNDPPEVVLNNQPTQLLQFATLKNTSFDFCIDVTDIENDLVTYSGSSFAVDNGSSLVPTTNLCFTYQPGDDFVGFDNIEVTLCDDGSPNECITISIEVEVLITNDPPVIDVGAEDTIYYVINKNTTLDVCIPVTDPDGDIVKISEIETILNTSVNTITSDLCLSYVPPFDFTGIEVLKVTTCDDVFPPLCDAVFIKITVLNVNNPPGIFVNGEKVDTVYYETKINSSLDICLPFEDPDDDPINITLINNISLSGTINLLSDVCIEYIPDLDETGLFWVETIVCDNATPQGCGSVIIGITVLPENSPPEIILEGVSVDTIFFQIINNEQLAFCLEAFDLEGDDIDISGIVEVEGGGFYIPGQGELCVIFIPDEGFVGTDSHIISICDSGDPTGCDEVVVIIEVIPFNHAPEIQFGGIAADTIYYKTATQTALSICLETFDQDGDNVAITEIVFNPVDATSTLVVNNSTCLDYTPGDGFLGTDWISATVCDDRNPALCDNVVISIEVFSVNSAPKITFNGNAVDSILVNGFEEVPMQFLFEVSDEENDDLSINGGKLLQGIGEFGIELQESIQVTYTPAVQSTGIHKISFGVCDNGLPALCDYVIITIDVRRINLPPEAKNDTLYALEGEIIVGNVLANDSDPDGDSIYVMLDTVIPPMEGDLIMETDGEFIFTPPPGFSGQMNFTYSISDVAYDSKESSADVLIEIEPIDKTITAFQALSPNGDGLNDFWMIQNIEFYPNNTVLVFDRWNNRIYETNGYNNTSEKWTGQSNSGLSRKDVNDGTYYFIINLGNGSEVVSGMIVLKR